MYGQSIQISERLTFVEGNMPSDNLKQTNPPNALYYERSGAGVLIDSSAGPVMRNAVESLLDARPPNREFTLINTHGHLDHVANNSVIDRVRSRRIAHLVSSRAFDTLDVYKYFGAMFTELSEFYDPMKAYQSRKVLFAMIRLVRFARVVLCRHELIRFYESLMRRTFRKFEPIEVSRNTMTPLEELPGQFIAIGGETWAAWPLLEGKVWALDERAHAPDEVIIYFPDEKHLHVADLTMELFPTWTDCDMIAIRKTLNRVLRMIRAGAVISLTDSHTHRVYGTPAAAEEFVGRVLESHLRFQDAMMRVLRGTRRMTVAQIYRSLKAKPRDSAVQKHFDLEFPRMPPALQTLICTSLRQSGCAAHGPHGRKRFQLPSETEHSAGPR